MKRLLFLLALTACFFSCQDMGEVDSNAKFPHENN